METTATAIATDEPTPETRGRGRPAGSPILLSDGRAWLLADGGLRRPLDEIRDRLFDEYTLRGSVPVEDLRWAGFALLLANYRLGYDEVGELFRGVPTDALADAVIRAMFGPGPEEAHAEGRSYRSYSRWARCSLLANGLDPAAIPASELKTVLAILEATGRTIPMDAYCESTEAAEKRRAMAEDVLELLREQREDAPAPDAPAAAEAPAGADPGTEPVASGMPPRPRRPPDRG